MRETRKMEFTGERFVPSLDGQTKYEHLHRYALALDFAAGKAVLDLGSGEGYGAALLARVAASVVGVDISPESVEHARRTYYYQNLEFLVGSCSALPLSDASADVVTSFETIEHHDRHEEMMAEIKRVLRPGGVLIISSPNRLTYSDEPGYRNPFHVRELYYDEFHGLLGRYFKHVCLYGQRLATGSFVYRLRNPEGQQLKTFSGDLEHLSAQVCDLPSPLYFVAVCSDASVQNAHAVNSVYLDGGDDLLKRAEAERLDQFRQLREQLAQIEEREQLQQVVEDSREQSAALEKQMRGLEAQVRRQAEELHAKGAELEAVRGRLAAAEGQAARQAEELSAERARLAAYEEQVERADGELAAQREQLSAVERLRGKYEAQLAQQSEALAAAQAQLSATQAQLAQQADELSKVHALSASQRAQLNQLALMLTEARTQLANKQALLSWMFHSRSWRVTTPLRQLSLSGSRLRQKLPHKGREVFRGYVDAPAEGGVAFGHIEVVGWAYSVVAPVVRVEAYLDNMPLGAVRYGHARADVAEAFPSQAPLDCGYAQRLPLDELLTGRRTLMIRVTDERGNFQDYTRTVVVESSAAPGAAYELPEAAPAPAAASSAAESAGPGGQAPAALVESFFGDFLSTSKKLLSSMAETYLENFLISNSTIEIPQFDEPEVSIILVLYNRAELTLQCLLSILKSSVGPYEVIVVDNASTDETPFLLKRIRGARVIENSSNLHYLRACNQAAPLARGRYLLLLNNDTQVLGGSIPSALSTLKSAPDIGAVGGKIILPDGKLQEAGSIIWRDGSCLGYGRGDSPSAPAYMFRRDVDYCSAAFLLTRRDLFLERGGFDEDYAPAYYEETDYCARLWEKGLRVVYDPNAIVLHYEFASSESHQTAVALQAEHRKVFVEKHKGWLQGQKVNAPRSVLAARAARRAGQKRILFLDDRVPHVNLGSGFPRSNRILRELVGMGHAVTFFPVCFPKEDWSVVYQDLPREVEVMVGYGALRLEEFLSERCDYYDFVFVSRPHNMRTLKALLTAKAHLCHGAKIIYDAEALFSLRDIGKARLEGAKLSAEERRRLIADELRLAEDCHRIVSVSDQEGREFTQRGFECVHTLGHAIPVSPTPNGFDERRDILFVGALHGLTSPNSDSMVWFTEKIFPALQRRLGGVRLRIAGPVSPSLRNRFAGDSIEVLGKVDDLNGLYNEARLFVAPTRYSAGIPHKAHEAAAHGLPMVATTLIGSQLGWADGEELLLADDPEEFAAACAMLYNDRALWERLRENALRRVAEDCSPEAFARRLRQIIE